MASGVTFGPGSLLSQYLLDPLFYLLFQQSLEVLLLLGP